MFGFGKKKTDFDRLVDTFKSEFGLKLEGDMKQIVFEQFTDWLKKFNLSYEAKTALFYRLVLMNFLCVAIEIKSKGQPIPDPQFLISISNRSVDLSEKATDHFLLESATSGLNTQISALFMTIGIRN